VTFVTTRALDRSGNAQDELALQMTLLEPPVGIAGIALAIPDTDLVEQRLSGPHGLTA
jgi:hypothetical protein